MLFAARRQSSGHDRRGDAMRVNTWGIGAVLTAAILLTGCSAPTNDSTNGEQAGSDASAKPTSAASDCPELTEGTTAVTMSVLGMESTRRYSPADEAAETITPYGSMIVIGDEAWVKSTNGAWQVADPASEDPEVKTLSEAATTLDTSDPLELASTNVEEYTVTGTHTRLGQDVLLLSGASEDQGVPLSLVFEVTSDYVLLASTASSEAEGTTTDAVLEVTEWDKKQDIVAPI
jgi:hypothetical protein